MRIRFWVSLLLLASSLSVLGQKSVSLPSGGVVTYSARGQQTVISLSGKNGKTKKLCVERDATVASGTAPTSVKLVAELPGSALILADTYPSIPGGMSYCQAGEERFLRVITLSGAKPAETYHTKLESCRDNVELADPGLEWSPENDTLAIHWLSAPGQPDKPKNETLKIGPDGKPIM